MSTNPRLTFFTFFGVIAGGLLLDLLSISVWADPRLAMPMMIVVLAGVAYAAFRNLAWGVAIVLVELLWGSHGRLLAASFGGMMVSLRMVIFVVVLAATFWDLRKRSSRDALHMMFSAHPARAPLALLVATFAIGLLLGFIRNPIGLVFQDANAWLFFALLPAFLLAESRGRRGWEGILLVAAGYAIIRFAALLFVFSHDTSDLALALYRWVRDTRLGEVTFFANGFPRVFLPSIALFFPIIGIAIARMDDARRIRVVHLAIIGGAVAVLIASFSRSFWLGGGATLAVFIGIQIIRRVSLLRRAIVVSVAAIIGIGLIAMLVRFPYPPSTMRAGFSQAVVDRLAIVGEAAVSNREQELIPLRNSIARHMVFGNGFGTTVTYETKDPRTLAEHPDGRYTTYAFEWGYLDHALEMGLLGVIALLWLLVVVIAHGWRTGGSAAALAWGLLAIAVTHVTSPYLNHPLGIGALLWLFAMTTVVKGQATLPLNGAKIENIN